MSVMPGNPSPGEQAFLETLPLPGAQENVNGLCVGRRPTVDFSSFFSVSRFPAGLTSSLL